VVGKLRAQLEGVLEAAGRRCRAARTWLFCRFDLRCGAVAAARVCTYSTCWARGLGLGGKRCDQSIVGGESGARARHKTGAGRGKGAVSGSAWDQWEHRQPWLKQSITLVAASVCLKARANRHGGCSGVRRHATACNVAGAKPACQCRGPAWSRGCRAACCPAAAWVSGGRGQQQHPASGARLEPPSLNPGASSTAYKPTRAYE
jgi:hypothetical protein